MTLSHADFYQSGWPLGFNKENSKALILYVVLQQMLLGATKSVVKR